MAQVEQLWDADDVGRLVKKHPRTIARLAREGVIPSIKLGKGSVRFDPRDIAAWIESSRRSRSS